MSSEKTEEPTQKKLEDAAKKGQSFKSRDMISTCILFGGVLMIGAMTFSGAADMFQHFIAQGFKLNPMAATKSMVQLFFSIVLPLLLVCVVATIVPSLAQSKMALATEAIKFNFEALDPVAGFKKIFSLKTVKETVKALLYLLIFTAVIIVFWKNYSVTILAQVHTPGVSAASIWMDIGTTLIWLCLGMSLLLLLLDGMMDYFLHIKNHKMEKHEVKREHKQNEVSPEVKSRRREVHEELLSEQVKHDITNSNFILANPTHIAIGIYVDVNKVPLPFVSVLATEARAKAVIKFATSKGVPVIRNKKLTRAVFNSGVRVYSFVPYEWVIGIYEVIAYLKQVEAAHNPIEEKDDITKSEESPESPEEAAPESNSASVPGAHKEPKMIGL